MLSTGGLARSCGEKSSNIKFEKFSSIFLQRKFYEELMPHIKFTSIKETLKNIGLLWAIEYWLYFTHHPPRLFFTSLILMVLDE